MNLCDFHFYKFIGKLTVFLDLQEFRFRHITVVSSTTSGQPSPHTSNLRLGIFSQRIHTTDYFEYRRRTCDVQITHTPITLANLSSIYLVSDVRCSSPSRHLVYVSRVDPSAHTDQMEDLVSSQLKWKT